MLLLPDFGIYLLEEYNCNVGIKPVFFNYIDSRMNVDYANQLLYSIPDVLLEYAISRKNKDILWYVIQNYEDNYRRTRSHLIITILSNINSTFYNEPLELLEIHTKGEVDLLEKASNNRKNLDLVIRYYVNHKEMSVDTVFQKYFLDKYPGPIPYFCARRDYICPDEYVLNEFIKSGVLPSGYLTQFIDNPWIARYLESYQDDI